MHDSKEVCGYGNLPKDRDLTAEEVVNLRHGYYASISFMDAQIGKILEALEEGGHVDDTIVCFTSDHGFHIGEHSLWGKTSNFELDARVPLIVADPSHTAGHGKKTDALAELVDLYPTLATLAGIEGDLPKRLEGASLSPVVADPSATVKDAAFTQHQHTFYGPPEKWEAWGYSVRTKRWRYTEWRAIKDGSVMARELYDHENDPAETVNVAEQYSEVIKSHSVRIEEQFGKR